MFFLQTALGQQSLFNLRRNFHGLHWDSRAHDILGLPWDSGSPIMSEYVKFIGCTGTAEPMFFLQAALGQLSPFNLRRHFLGAALGQQSP